MHIQPLLIRTSLNLQIKPTIKELATGRNNVEEWSFLPETGDRFYLGRTMFDSHFVLMHVGNAGQNRYFDSKSGQS